MSTTDHWYDCLKRKEIDEGKQIGFYSRITQRRWIEAIKRTLNDLPLNSKILKTDAWNEAAGRSLLEDLRGHYDIHICDISPSIIERVKNCYPNSHIMDINNLDFPDHYFDAILDISTSDHCEVSKLKSIIDSYSRILRKKGRLLLIHNSSKSIAWKILRLVGKKSPAYSGTGPVFYFSPDHVKTLLQYNFEIIDVRCTNAFSWAKPLLNGIPISNDKLINFIAKVELNTDHHILTWLGRQYLFFCERK